MLISLLYFQLIGLGLSTLSLVLLGQRVKKGHWLVSLLYLGLITGGAWFLQDRFISNLKTTGFFWAFPSLIGIFVITLTEKNWNAAGQGVFTYTFTSGLAFLAYAIKVILFSHLGPWSFAFSLLLFFLEILAIILMITQAFEVTDVLCRIRWMRRADPVPTIDYFPKVSLHLPAYNEPPDMVIESLNALAALDYPNYEVIVIDDNTTDPNIWKPVEAHCSTLGFKFFHLENWPGYKSGALNYALKQTDPAAEIIGVVDSDYVVQPGFLRDLVGFFKDPKMAFVQTPQDYRGFKPEDHYANACYNAYLYFFKLSMMSRNERNGIIFAGTMGLIRASVLREMGGWDEWCITEDAEISLRILSHGYRSHYIDRSYGHGIMPLNFEGLKKQRFRWAFGGMQILRMHWNRLSLFPWGKKGEESGLSFGQKYDYLIGGLQWLSDPLTLSFSFILLIGAGSLAFFQTLFLQPMIGATIYTPFAFIFFGLLRNFWALRVTLKISLIKAVRAFAVLLGMTWVVSLACLLGLTRSQGTFLRTPKSRKEALFWRSLRINLREAFLVLLCLGAVVALAVRQMFSPGGILMMGLLCWQSLIYGSSLAVGFWSYRSELMAHPVYAARMSRSTGLWFGKTRTGSGLVLVSLLALLVIFFFSQAVNNVTEKELIASARLSVLNEPGNSLIRTPEEKAVKVRILMEEEASLNGDTEAAVSLWAEDGVIVDMRNTPDNAADDRVWIGRDAIRQRYIEEYRQRKYLKLVHSDIAIVIEGDQATLINDLEAVIQTQNGIQNIRLSRADKWVLKKKGNEWKIVRLEVNRPPK